MRNNLLIVKAKMTVYECYKIISRRTDKIGAIFYEDYLKSNGYHRLGDKKDRKIGYELIVIKQLRAPKRN